MTQHHPKSKRNLWPYGILLVIFIGIILIIISVYISLKHPVSDDMPFFQKHTDTDTHINKLLQDTNTLRESYNFYIQANAQPTKDSVLMPYSPYLRPPHRDKEEPNTATILYTKTLNTLYLLADELDSKSKITKPLAIEAFIQKIGTNKPQEIYIYDSKDGSFIKSQPLPNSPKIPLGKFTYNPKTQTFTSPAFEIELEGRWIISLYITQDTATTSNKNSVSDSANLTTLESKNTPQNQRPQVTLESNSLDSNALESSERDNAQTPLSVILEKEFFSMPKPEIDTQASTTTP